MTDNPSNPIDVSVYMLTYYHEKYIRQAIESVLAQKTNYRYELVISDDYSMDGTRDILREYEASYPDIIRVNYNESNISIPANIYKARCNVCFGCDTNGICCCGIDRRLIILDTSRHVF